ncbi:glycosyltransferase family 4 protein [Algoriphagus aestuariicola]|uniref:Glycosyltransferase family 4 protein n=1 Tax=Algoriphagus aestuariicola TaxID=1852016 RepID=A0ABS3BTV1_9BACT|nr:glycosyltransferase family 4 protein [Algoriphagus aestuariicola]MBN7801119.1 glycosyltransferase family 4 protein [Algoriphagus aestuariicola]
MRLLFITDNFPPEVNAPANRTFEHCKEWVRAGHEVTVITCAPNFPQGRVYDGYKNNWKSEEITEGIRVIRVWSYITANEGTFRRILDYVSFGATSFFAGLSVKADVILGTSPQFFSAMSAWALSVAKRKKWIMEVRDLWPESIVAVGAMTNRRLISFLETLEMSMYKSANKIVVVTDAFKKKISEKGIVADKIVVHKNGVDLSKYYPGIKPVELLDRLGLRGKFILSYIGTHGMAHGLDFVLDQAIELEAVYPDLHFLLMGDGANKANLIKRAEEAGVQNITFLDSVPKDEVIDYLHLMDVALVNLKKSDTFLTVIPSKIFEAAAVEKPILLGLQGETKGIIEQYGAGVCFEPENGKEFKEALNILYSSRGNFEHYEQGCRNLAKAFERNRIANLMLTTIQSV